MGMLVNYSLIICGVIALMSGISYYAREKKPRLFSCTMLAMSIFIFLWCGGYSFMGFSENEVSAYVGRTIGLIGIFGFLTTEVIFILNTIDAFAKIKRIIFIGLIIFASMDLIFYSRPEVLEFTRIDGRMCYYAREGFGRNFHNIYIIFMFVFMLTVGVCWYRNCKLKRDRVFVICLFLANLLIVVFTLPDTVLPSLNIPSFPSTGYGSFLAFMLIWVFATKYNAFSISLKNLSSYIYNYVNSPIIVFDNEYKLVLANDYARQFLNIRPGSSHVLSDMFEIATDDARVLFNSFTDSKKKVDCRLIAMEKQVPCSLKFTKINDNFGDTYCYVCFVYDLSEEEANLEQINHMKNQVEKELNEKTKQVECLTLQSITTIANAIDQKDIYTKGHSIHVAEYSTLIARELGWSDNDIQNLKYMALLHDIGKICIPDSVLNKPDKLTDDEFKLIKTHTVLGGDILKDITIVKNLDAGAMYHHERYDGKGYPHGLCGEEIPFAARIICIADAYDAMNSNRVYRPNLSPEAIRQELVNGRGTQFDPELTDIFLGLLDNNKLTIDTNAYEKTNSIADESGRLLNHIMANLGEEWKKESETDYLTGLLNRKAAESKITALMKQNEGCMAIVDLDNLKTINDRFGHIAGDCAIKTVAEVLMSHSHNTVAARLGGDEFMYYMNNVNEKAATEVIEGIMHSFRRRKQKYPEIGPASLSIGLSMALPTDSYNDVYQKADKALYYIKQNGKDGYSFYNPSTEADSVAAHADLKRIAESILKQGMYQGTLGLEYREFAKLYNFINNMAARYDYNIQLLMITATPPEDSPYTKEAKEDIMSQLNDAITNSLRNVDVATRYNSSQFLVILTNADRESINIITDRIFKNFEGMCPDRAVTLSHDFVDLGEIEL